MDTHENPAGPEAGTLRTTIADRARCLSREMAQRPGVAIAVCFGAGYLAGKLPLFRLLGGVSRVVFPLAPPVLALLGASRVWDVLSPADVPPDGNDESDALNGLLGQAHSARTSYQRLATRFSEEDRRVLDHLRAVHEEAGRQLRGAIHAAGGLPKPAGGTWAGAGDHLLESGSKLAESPVFPLILAAEEDLVRALEAALLLPELGESNKSLIRRHLLPRAQENVNALLRHRARTSEEATVP
jgi:hypothetical protein